MSVPRLPARFALALERVVRARGRVVRAAALALLTLVPAGLAAGAETSADPLTLEILMQGMASTTGVRAAFREEKQLALLDAPLVSEGMLYFVPPARLARITTQPGASALVIDGGRLSFTDATGVSDVNLAGNRVARTLVENFVVLFAGDLAALRERYDVAFEAKGESWRIRLVPKAAPLATFIASVELSGEGPALTEMELREADGDRTLTRFERVETGARFTPEELARLFSPGASTPQP
jgi:outer membrane lipoprotein-sorting protein